MELKDVKGLGAKSIEKLKSLGISSAEELLLYLPYNFQVYELGLTDGRGTLEGVIASEPKLRFVKKHLDILSFHLNVSGDIYEVVIFNRAFMKPHIQVGRTCYVTGQVKNKKFTANELKFEYEPVKPIYKLDDIAPKTFRKWIDQVLPLMDTLDETLPEELIQKYKLISRKEMVYYGHKATSFEMVKQFFRRNKYEEFLYYQLGVKYFKEYLRQDGLKLEINPKELEPVLARIPFTLTNSQKMVITDVIADLNASESMMRLVQGDVGSGKTIVALVVMKLLSKHGYQSALMAPTEVLAKQHYKNACKLFPDEEILLLTKETDKKEAYPLIASGTVKWIIGTHALFSKGVEYHNLGFVVVDEQHRFGVKQRQALIDKGERPNVLSLSATPIPRTLAITLFGDMEVSQILEKPKGRKPVKSKMLDANDLPRLVKVIQQTIDRGEQVYVVTPMIEESELINITHAKEIHESLKRHVTGRVGLLHGKMKTDEKEEVMGLFEQNEIQVLVSTTVIEVGVDVPNASLMIIMNSERFGLSQLHQLRGRIGRGEAESTCIFVVDTDTELAKERIKVLVNSNDGFEIAEADLSLRGPGDFFGSAQSGFPKFNFADVFHDFKILEVARDDATNIVYNKTYKTFQPFKDYLKALLEAKDD